MAYTTTNEQQFEKYLTGDCWSIDSLGALLRALRSVNFFYTDSRAAAIRAIEDFASAARDGHAIVNGTTRFPDAPYYFSFHDDFDAILAGLQSTLAWRADNVAKDTEVHKSVRNGKEPDTSGDQKNFLGQSAQDSLKRFEILVASLSRYKSHNATTRRTFEKDCSAVWA